MTDPLRLSINPQEACSPTELMSRLSQYYAEGDLGTVVMSKSLHADGNANAIQADATSFAERLKKKLPDLEICFQDEFGSSKEARSLLIQQGVRKKKRSARGALDSVSAAIILERYLLDKGIW